MAHRWFPDEIYFEKDAKDLYALNRQEGHACLVLLQGIYAGGGWAELNTLRWIEPMRMTQPT